MTNGRGEADYEKTRGRRALYAWAQGPLIVGAANQYCTGQVNNPPFGKGGLGGFPVPGRTEELIGPLERDQSLRLVKWNRASYSRFS